MLRGRPSAVELFGTGEHADNVVNSSRPSLLALRLLHPVVNGVSVGIVERRVKIPGSRIPLERGDEVRMGFGNSLAFVRSVPPTIGPGSLHLRQAARRHHSLVDHCFDPTAVTQRPRTL